jgi:hypothetical protein
MAIIPGKKADGYGTLKVRPSAEDIADLGLPPFKQ